MIPIPSDDRAERNDADKLRSLPSLDARDDEREREIRFEDEETMVTEARLDLQLVFGLSTEDPDGDLGVDEKLCPFMEWSDSPNAEETDAE